MLTNEKLITIIIIIIIIIIITKYSSQMFIWQVTFRSFVMDLSIKSYTYLYLFLTARPIGQPHTGYVRGLFGDRK